MGKSAFAASFCKKLEKENRLLGAYFCRYTEQNESPSKIIKSWSAQCCERLCDSKAKNIFEKAFMEWNKIPDLDKPSSSDLFDLLLTNPLKEYSKLKTTSNQNTILPPMVLLIDALDEVSLKEREPLLKILSSKLQDLPDWVRVMITSRPEADIVSSFRRLNPIEILEDDPRHLEDIRLYVETKLRGIMNEDEVAEGVDLVVNRSEGRFIYVSNVIEEITKNKLIEHLSVQDLDYQLPEGLGGWYREFFVRMKSRNVGVDRFFEEVIFRVLKVIVSSKGPLSVKDVKNILNLEESHDNFHEQRLIDELHQIFPLRTLDNTSNTQYFTPFHKSVFDWLTDKNSSGSYGEGKVRDNFYISNEEGNALFVSYFRTILSKWIDEGDESFRPVSGSYFYQHGFDHLGSSVSIEDVIFGLDKLFVLEVVGSLLEEIGISEVLKVVGRYVGYLSSILSSQLQSQSQLQTQSKTKTRSQLKNNQKLEDLKKDLVELKLFYQLIELSSPGLKSREVDSIPFQFLCRLTPSQYNGNYNRLRRLHNECNDWRSVSEKGYWIKPLKNYLTGPGGALEKIIKMKEVSIE